MVFCKAAIIVVDGDDDDEKGHEYASHTPAALDLTKF